MSETRVSPLRSRSGQILIALLSCLLIAFVAGRVAHPAALVGAAVAPLAIVAVLSQPFLVVLGFVAFSFFRIHEVAPQLYPLRIPQLLALGALVSLGWNVAVGRMVFHWSRELTAFSVFFALTTLGLAFSTNPGESIASWTGNFVKIAVMTVAISCLVASRADLALTTRAFIACGILVGAVALYNKAMGVDLVEGTRVSIGRGLESILGDPNDLALVLLFPASFALSVMLTPGLTLTSRLYGAFCFVIVLLAIIATQSRGGLLGVVSVMGVFGYRRIRSKVVLAALGAAALAALFVVAGVSDRASGGAAEEGVDASAMGRLHAWAAAFNMALAHPLTGVGLDNFINNYFFYSDFWDGKYHAVHSTWFKVLAETGFVGCLAFLIMVGVVARSALRSMARLDPEKGSIRHPDPEVRAMAQAIVAGLAGFAVSGTFLTMGFTWPIYILLALTAALARQVDALAECRSRDQ